MKAVIFDLGNVLVPFDFKRAYSRLAPLISCQPEEIPARLRSTDLVQRFETGQIEPPRFVDELAALLGFRMSYTEFCDMWTSVFMVEPLVPEALVARLASTYRLVVLSNTNAIHFPMLKASYPILSHFQAFVLSYEVGATKPAARIYQEAIRQAGCAPPECFFTDDIPLYVEAARQQGIDAVRFQNAAQIEQELRLRGAY